MVAVAHLSPEPVAEPRPLRPAPRRGLRLACAPAFAEVAVERLERPVRPSAAVLARRRAVALAAVLLVTAAVAGLLLVATGAIGPAAATASTGATTPLGPGATDAGAVVVRPGDTYWSIASALVADGGYGERDVRDVVDDLVAANDGRSLAPGDRLEVVGP